MSVYKISDNIIFNSLSFTLENTSENERMITITHSSSRCLTALLDAKGEIISRKDLLQFGWGYAGLVVTSNSLSQAISLLRKAFKEIGLDMVTIATVSKIGYRLTMQRSNKIKSTLHYVNHVDYQKPKSHSHIQSNGKRNLLVFVSLTMIAYMTFTLSFFWIFFEPTPFVKEYMKTIDRKEFCIPLDKIPDMNHNKDTILSSIVYAISNSYLLKKQAYTDSIQIIGDISYSFIICDMFYSQNDKRLTAIVIDLRSE